MKLLFIGDVAKEIGLSTHAIRFYEKLGLLDHTQRTASGYRVYSHVALERLAFIKKAQRLGFTLEEIRDVFILSQRGQRPCIHVHKLAILKIGELTKKIQEALTMKQELQRLLRNWKRAARRRGAAICPHIDEFVPAEAVQPQRRRRNTGKQNA